LFDRSSRDSGFPLSLCRVDACLTARKLVPTQPYEWPTPPILADPASRFHLDLPEIEPVAPHERDFPRLKEELDPDNDDLSPTDEGGEADGREGAFSKLKIVLSPDLELSEGGRRSLVKTLMRAGGRVVKQKREMEEIGSSQVLIAKFRDGDIYLEVRLAVSPVQSGSRLTKEVAHFSSARLSGRPTEAHDRHDPMGLLHLFEGLLRQPQKLPFALPRPRRSYPRVRASCSSRPNLDVPFPLPR
jgi:hypothetical protein